MADAGQGPVTAPREAGYMPYDATSDADCGGWQKISANLPGGSEDLWRGDLPDGPGPWRQT